jgi:hypothetical protein
LKTGCFRLAGKWTTHHDGGHDTKSVELKSTPRLLHTEDQVLLATMLAWLAVVAGRNASAVMVSEGLALPDVAKTEPSHIRVVDVEGLQVGVDDSPGRI